jgi:hypothetical protein
MEHEIMTEEEYEQYLSFLVDEQSNDFTDNNFSFELPVVPPVVVNAKTESAHELIQEQNKEFEFSLKCDQAAQTISNLKRDYETAFPTSSQIHQTRSIAVPSNNLHNLNCKCHEYKNTMNPQEKKQKFKTVTIGGYICRQYRE